MAFWRRIGKKSNNKTTAGHTVSKPNLHQANENDDTPPNSLLAFSSSGDLGDSIYNNLQCHQKTIHDGDSMKSVVKGGTDVGDLADSNLIIPSSFSRRSRLSKNLQETLMDLTALSHFQQYLENRQSGTYLTLLHDLKNYQLMLSSCQDGGDYSKIQNSTSSSSGFSDDTSLDSPSRAIASPPMTHSLLCERRRIIQKYFESDSSDYLEDVVSILSEETATILDVLDHHPDHVFHQAQNAVNHLLENNYWVEFVHSEFHYRYQLEVITGGKLTIADVIYNDTCLFYFMEFMDQEGKRHWIEFWLAADNYRSHWNSSANNTNSSSDALIIYNKYFSLQATRPLGLVDTIRSSIEENICLTHLNGPGPDCFESALYVLFTAMEKKYLPLFLSSPTFSQYVNEISSALRNCSNGVLSRSKRSASSSTINSEVSGLSFSVSTSALAPTPAVGGGGSSGNSLTNNTRDIKDTAENSMIRLVNGISNESLMIENRQLNDPDSLWKRKSLSLALGRLTTFGRFYSDVEFPFDNRKTESKLSKAVKKFVFVEEDQEKEEMAWQVAEMIVKEVLALTSRGRRLS